MSDTIRDFLVGFGFKGDEASAKKVVDLNASVEAAVTKAGAAESAKRAGAEVQAGAKRVSLVQAIGKLLGQTEQERADKGTKIRKDEAGKDEKIQAEKAKKAKDRRAAALREIQANATKMAAFALGAVAAVEATALGIVYATDKAAKSFEKLNYAAQRAGSTPGKMTAFSYAISQVGGTAEEGNAMVSSLGKAFRDNENGMVSTFKRLGIEARDAKGHIRDMATLSGEFGTALAKKRQEGPYGNATANSYGAIGGWSEEDVLNATDPRVGKFAAERQAIDAKTGADQGAAAAGGTVFEQSMRKLRSVLDSLATRIDTELFDKLRPRVEDFSKWIEDHGKAIADVTSSIVEGIAKVTEAFVKSQVVQDAMTNLGTGLEKFADYINSSQFQTDIKTFADDVAALARSIRDALQWMHLIPSAPVPTAQRADKLGITHNAGVFLDAMERSHGGKGLQDETRMKEKLAAFEHGQPDDHQTTAPPVASHVLSPTHDASQATAQGGFWNGVKKMLGIGPSDPDAKRVKDAVIATAEATKKLADAADRGGGVGSGEGAGAGDSGHGLPSIRYGHDSEGHYRHTPGQKYDISEGGTGSKAPIGGGTFKDKAPGISARLKQDFPGLTDEDTAAILGNLGHESAGFKAFEEGGHGPGRGWAQWTDPGRKARFFEYAKQRKLDPHSDDANYGFLRWELQHTHKGAIDALTHANGLRAKTRAFEGIFEGAGVKAYASRDRYADAALGAIQNAPKSVASAPYTSPQIGDQAALDAEDRVRSGKPRTGDAPMLAEYHRQQASPVQQTVKVPPTAASAVVEPEPKVAVPHAEAGYGTGHDARRPEMPAMPGAARMIPAGRLVAPVETLKSPALDSEHQKLADAMRIGGSNPIKVDVTDASVKRIGHVLSPAHQKLADAMKAGAGNQHLRNMQAVIRARNGHVMPFLHPDAHLSAAARNSIDASSHRHVAMTHNPTFNIHGGEARDMLADAHRLAGRGHADMVRNLSVSEA